MGALSHELFGSGQRLALLHGANQTARSWKRVSDLLSSHYEVMSVDLPFHGRSADVDVDTVMDLGEVLGDTVGVATYIGYFIGARGALELALAHPELVERLVLIGYVAGIKDEDARTRRRTDDERIAASFENASPDELDALFDAHVRRRLARPDFNLDAEGSAIELATNFENSPLNLAKLLRKLGSGALPSRHGVLHQLNMPILIIWGENAPEFGEEAEEVASLIGENATVEMLAGAGHPAPFERPKEFVQIVEDWLSRTGG